MKISIILLLLVLILLTSCTNIDPNTGYGIKSQRRFSESPCDGNQETMLKVSTTSIFSKNQEITYQIPGLGSGKMTEDKYTCLNTNNKDINLTIRNKTITIGNLAFTKTHILVKIN